MFVMFRAVSLIGLLLLSHVLFAAEPSLQERLQRIESFSAAYGEGGQTVLKTAYEALSQSSYTLVGLEDLWATALKEGRTLFSHSRLWGATPAARTGDMLGQTTIGPWQITIANAREYGADYGVVQSWEDKQVISWLASRPVLQARIAADFMEESYKSYGRRAPLAVQRYFWLDAFVQKRIGQGPWYASVLANSPEAMVQTGFYAKQLMLGSRFNPEGLLYWLYRTGDHSAVEEVLDLWRQKGYPILSEDLEHCFCDSAFRDWLSAKIRATRMNTNVAPNKHRSGKDAWA